MFEENLGDYTYNFKNTKTGLSDIGSLKAKREMMNRYDHIKKGFNVQNGKRHHKKSKISTGRKYLQ